MNFNASRVPIFIVMDVLYRYRFSSFFDLFNRTDVVEPITRLIPFMGNHITGCPFRQLSRLRSRIGHLNCVIISVNNIEGIC